MHKLIGTKQSPEHIEKRRLANLGKKRTEESNQKNRESHLGQVPWNKNKSGYKAKPCSDERKRKIGEAQFGDKNHKFIGKTYEHRGYIYYSKRFRPETGGRKRYQHCVVAEQSLGRPLTLKEVIHHINFIKNDNRPENLYLFPSQSEHATYHLKGIREMLISNLQNKIFATS